MDIKSTVISILITALVAACSKEDVDSTRVANTTPSADASIMISRDGVGPINASTPFNMHQVTMAFPEYSVTEYTQFKDGNSAPVIRVSEEGKPLITINPDQALEKIFSVFVFSPKIGSALGHTVGQPFSSIYTYEETEPCIPGTDEFAAKVLCIAPKAPNLIYVFTGKWDGPTSETPPVAILSNWILDTIVWKPN